MKIKCIPRTQKYWCFGKKVMSIDCISEIEK
jgi:hypothetical protein